MKACAIIPARGGSKRLHRKNLAEFHGRPIIAWTIQAALDCALFRRVVVSTDDMEIASVAAAHGAEIVMRPEELATDTARVVEVCLHFLDQEKARSGDCDTLCCLYATAPMRTAQDIAATMALLSGDCSFAMAVSAYPLPPHQALALEGSVLRPMWPDLVNRRSDELPELVCDNGSTYAVQTEPFRVHKSFYGPGLRAHRMPFLRSLDINTAEDLELARLCHARSIA